MLRRAIQPIRLTRPLHIRPASTKSYLGRLKQRYPSADPPSLFISFLILHELTAILPLSILFGTFHYLGIGAGIVAWTLSESESTTQPSLEQEQAGKWTKEGARIRVREWMKEGEDQAERMGRRYGWFGWEKESREERIERKKRLEDEPARDVLKELSNESLKVSGDVANLVAAYLVVKVSSRSHSSSLPGRDLTTSLLL